MQPTKQMNKLLKNMYTQTKSNFLIPFLVENVGSVNIVLESHLEKCNDMDELPQFKEITVMPGETMYVPHSYFRVKKATDKLKVIDKPDLPLEVYTGYPGRNKFGIGIIAPWESA